MSQSMGNGSSDPGLRNGVGSNVNAGTNSGARQTSNSAANGQSTQPTSSVDQPVQESDPNEMRADRLLRLILAILRAGSDESAARLVEAIRQNAREGSDEVDLRGVAESAIRICRDDPGVQEELETVEALLQEFGEDAIYTRFPM